MDRIGIRNFSLRLRGVPRQFYIDELKIIQPAIGAEFLHQLFMAADVGNGAVFNDHDAIGATDGGKPVSDYNNRAPGHKILQR
jgi:hypothetical protein